MTSVRIPGYHIKAELYNGSRTIVYQGYRETDALPVVIKLLKNPYPSFSELVQFRNQYTIVKHIQSPLIIQTYGLEAYQNGYALVMEDFGGISLKEYVQHPETLKAMSLDDFLPIAIAITDTLNILYQERIIHKDIKPNNILINPETKQIKLIDFSIASLLPRETQTLISPNVLEGTLAYISPEQTGRMNRGIDYRTDFYSLGVTCFELLTGKLPFNSTDPMELVHCHIAQTAPLLHTIRPEIPVVLSEIINKLLAKNAEDRYQSTLGLKFDLENCWHQFQNTGTIESFVIAQRDVCDRFLIPDQLYGRETEVATLMQAFDRVSQGATEMMLVAGFSGIGKTAVVNEVHKPIVRQRGYFIKGKYDQLQRNIPFSAFVQAFRDLMCQLLTENDTQIQAWRTQILAAVGENGQVIIDVIPELERIIGQQSPALELSGTASQNRFNLLFQKFTQVFTTAEHPLVIFLDDLQWADAASLKLMQLLMKDGGHLLIIGAYRDNEVNPAHPLMLTLQEIAKNQAKIHTITLAALTHQDINLLVADTLKCSVQTASNLAQLVCQKTQGNPFFTTQFLKALHQDKFIKFNFDLGCWECDISQVTQQAVTEDVVTFMAVQLGRLPLSTQHILQLAACIGNQFDLATLAIVSKHSEIETAACLWKALQEGLILPNSDIYKFYVGNDRPVTNQEISQTVTYKFLHDRVQQAAYSLIPEAQKQSTHYQIGQQLFKNISESEREERIFEIVNQMNMAVELITQQPEKDELAQLNLIAGCKAKNATAYHAAVKYFTVGRELLGSDRWQTQYQLTISLYVEATEAAYLNTDLSQMEELAEVVLQQATTPLDAVKVYAVRISAYTSQGQLLKAINSGLTILKQLDIDLPESPDVEDVAQVAHQAQALLGNKKPTELLNLPEMTNPQILAVMLILHEISVPAYLTKPHLNSLIIMTQMNLSMTYGNAPISALNYASYGLFLCAVAGEIEQGYEFGQLSLKLLAKFKEKKTEARVLFVISTFIFHWKVHVSEILTLLKNAYSSGWESSSLTDLAYSAYGYSFHAYFMGCELSKLESEVAAYSKVLAEINQQTQLNYNEIYHQVILNLLGQTANPLILLGEVKQEQELLTKYLQKDDKTALWHFFLNKLILCYLFGEVERAFEYIECAKNYLAGGKGMFNIPAFYFYTSLTCLAILPHRPEFEQENILEQVANYQQKMQKWINHNSSNHLHKFYLVEAEKDRILGQYLAAIKNYDLAISLAQENGYIQEAALSNELAAKFYLAWNRDKVAQTYMQEAYYGYARWGAKAKTLDIERRYPQLLQMIIQQQRVHFNSLDTMAIHGSISATQTTDINSTSISDTLDLISVLKASQAISSSLELNELITSLTQIILENSGAKKSALILPQGQNWIVKAITFINEQANSPAKIQTLLDLQTIDSCPEIPPQIINYVKNTQESILIENCQTDVPGIMGEYLLEHQPKSVFCQPIIHQGHLVGILYLENQLATGVFTQERLHVINLLASQAAISLENSQLFQQAQQALQDSLLKQISIDRASIAVWWIEPDGKIFYVNDAACQDLGYVREQIIGKYMFDFDPVFPQELWADHWLTISQTGSRTFETYHRHQSGNIYPVEVTINYLEFNGKEYNFAFIKNISDRKQAEIAIQQKSQELSQALQELQTAQLQIIQSEKMSALGNLVAGVAHEMNNPLGFIAATLKQAKPVIADITEHLQLYQDILPEPGDAVLDHAAAIDLNYSLEDLPKMLDAMVMACDRLKNISTSLRTFSRADQDYKVPCNIHEGINSTILILKHRLKANEQRPAVEVITEYADLPPVECFPGQLNQVFMNIIANAIDALDESNHGRSFDEIKANPNQIIVKTSRENDYVKITIADNGKGMNQEVKHKIFDHLFTTKAVGKGTGLGLAIARQIVEESHNGQLICNSVLGEGTEFVIAIPM